VVDTGIEDVVVSLSIGAAGSLALNKPMHAKGVPELARHVVGGVLFLIATAIIAPKFFLKALAIWAGLGVGVGGARLVSQS
jgi:hypothetical protein